MGFVSASSFSKALLVFDLSTQTPEATAAVLGCFQTDQTTAG